MNTKTLVPLFLKNLALSMGATMAGTSFMAFVLLGSLGSKVSYQGGVFGQAATSILIGWVLVISLALAPLIVFSLIVSVIQTRKTP